MQKYKHILILVNGYTGRFDRWFPDFCMPLQPYWSERGNQFIAAAKQFFGDVDHVEFVSGDNHFYSTAKMRQRLGFKFGCKHLDQFQAEKISILGHSMGSAFAEGIADALRQAKKKVEKIVHLSTADARGIRISADTKDIPRLQLSFTQDYTLRMSDMFTLPKKRYIKGVERYGIVRFEMEKLHRRVKLKDRLQWNSHFDTKTFGYVFEFLKELKNLQLQPIAFASFKESENAIYQSHFSLMHAQKYFQTVNPVKVPIVFVKLTDIEFYDVPEKGLSVGKQSIVVTIRNWWKRLKY